MNLLAELRSPREMSFEQSPGRFEVKFHLISRQDLRRNWPILLFLTLVFCGIPLLYMPYLLFTFFKGAGEEPIILLAAIPALAPFAVFPIVVYRVGIRKVFTVRSLLFDENEFSVTDVVFGKKRKKVLAFGRADLPQLSVKKAWGSQVQGISDTKLMLLRGSRQVEVIGHRTVAELERFKQIYERYRAGTALDSLEGQQPESGTAIANNVPASKIRPDNKQSMWRAVFGTILGARRSSELPRSTFHKVNALLGALTAFLSLGIFCAPVTPARC